MSEFREDHVELRDLFLVVDFEAGIADGVLKQLRIVNIDIATRQLIEIMSFESDKCRNGPSRLY